MEIRISEELNTIINFSREEAIRTGSYGISPDHLMLGIIRQGDNTALDILKGLETDIREMKSFIDSKIFTNEHIPYSEAGHVTFSRGAQNVLSITVLEATRLNGKEASSQHLLLALCRNTGSYSQSYLRDTGIDYGRVMAYIGKAGLTGMEKTRESNEDDAVREKHLAVEEFGYDVGRDWFRELYEAELAERKQKGQDFTAPEVSELLAELSGADGSVHEPTAGTGGLLIAAWNRARTAVLPWEFFPSQHMVDCWELSGRSVPILLFNLSIRGIMGYVHHGDVLEQKAVMHYVLLNRSDDALGFSEIIKDPEGRMRIVQDI